MNHQTKYSLRRALLVGFLSAVATSAYSQDAYTVRIFSYSAGSVSDALARSIADRLSVQMKATVIVENRPGVAGATTVGAVARSRPDGHTLGLVATTPLTVGPLLQKLPYDPEKEITPIAAVMTSPGLIVATPAFQGKTLGDAFEKARKKPEALSYASSGPGTVGNLMMEALAQSAKVKFLHVPYKATGAIVTDALAGLFDVFVTNPSPLVDALIKGGKLRVIAVAAPQRLNEYPDAPTLAEAGFKGTQLYSTFGLIAPSGMDSATLRRLKDEIAVALRSPQVADTIRQNLGQHVPLDFDFPVYIKRERIAAAAIIKAGAMKLE
jgi:tripartite-type tricarboxylate transporter receptor subunit TctC